MASYSGTLDIRLNVTQTQLLPGDVMTIEVVSEYLPTSKNYTASLGEGRLSIEVNPPINGYYPFATSSANYGNFISRVESPNVLVFNESISAFYGSYLQVPSFVTGSGESETQYTSSLYSRYSDITYPFIIGRGDKIIITSKDGRLQESVVFNAELVPSDGHLRLYLLDDIDYYFLTNPTKIDIVLIVKRIEDEQNIIMSFNKAPGNTSYGFLISEDIDPNILNSISVIQANVQQQLLSTQQNSG